jgi:hypothetical protein
MQTILAVIEDLFTFAFTSLFGGRGSIPFVASSHSSYIDASQLVLLPKKETHTSSVTSSSDTVRDHALHSGVLHFIGVPDVALHTDPVVAFDVVTTYVPYGASVRLMKLGGRWAYVRYKEEEGWILKDTLREQAREVQPLFEDGVMYGAEDPETKKLRLYIGDAFCGGKVSIPLTDAEYVTFKLLQKGLLLPWDQTRPRTPGVWQKLLRGKQGIHSSIAPHTGAVMEYIIDDVGYVAYVEAVFPDESIKISSVGLTQEGVYTLQTLSKEHYRELHPIFISVV